MADKRLPREMLVKLIKKLNKKVKALEAEKAKNDAAASKARTDASPAGDGDAEGHVPRDTLLKLVKRLRGRMKTVESKHASVVKKYDAVKKDGDFAKARVLELEAQVEGMSEELSTQTQLLEAQNARASASEGGPSDGRGNAAVTRETERLRAKVRALEKQNLEARNAGSPEQQQIIANLQRLVEEYKARAVSAMQFGSGGASGDGAPQDGKGGSGAGASGGDDTARLRAQVAQLLDECQGLRARGQESKAQVVRARADAEKLRAEVARLREEGGGAAEREQQTGRILLQQREELARERERWQLDMSRQRARVSALESKLAKAEDRVGSQGTRAQSLVDKIAALESQATQYALKQESLERELQDKETACADLEEACRAAAEAHSRELRSREQRATERYTRLMREFTSYREETKNALAERRAAADKAETECARLRDQIATGKPDERRLFELAELQARREHKIRKVSDQMRSHVQLIAQHQKAIETYRARIRALNEELEAAQLAQKRGGVDVDYLKTLMIKFMQLHGQPDAQIALYPVISKLLCFSEEELQQMRDTSTVQGPGGVMGYVMGLGTGVAKLGTGVAKLGTGVAKLGTGVATNLASYVWQGNKKVNPNEVPPPVPRPATVPVEGQADDEKLAPPEL